MWESIAALNCQTQLIDKLEKRLIINQKLNDFRAKIGVFFSVEEESEFKMVSFFISHKGFGTTFRQSEANRRILRELFASFAPIFHQGDVRWTCPAHFALKAARHLALEGLV